MRIRRLSTALMVPLVVAACGEGAQEQEMGGEQEAAAEAGMEEAGPAGVSLSLVPKNESGINGTAMLYREGDSTRIEVRLAGVASGTTYPVHVHEGTCQEGGGVAVGLSSVAATDSVGSSETTVASSRLMPDQRYFIQAHLPDGTPAACGDVPSEAEPPGGAEEGSTSG